MIKKTLTTALLCLGLGLSAPIFASVDNPALEKALDKKIKNELEMCLDTITQIENIGQRYFIVYTPYGSYSKEDDFCSGNITFSGLAEARYDYDTGKYTIVTLDILENISIEFTYIDEMIISDGILTLHTRSYGSKDGQHRPRDQYVVKIRLWDMKLLSNQFVGRLPEETFYEVY